MPTRLLVIDDRPQDRFLAKRALAAEFPDLILTEAGDRADFDAALESCAYDAIVTDYQLRWSDGLQILEEIRRNGLDTPVVMFTHTGSEEVAAAGLRAGLADYIIKTPTHYGRLAHAVRIAIQNATTARNERDARAREQEALRTAEEAIRLKDEFLATLSHELRTPLNAISGWLQVIKSQPVPDSMSRGLTAIERNTGLLTRLISDLVDVSRIVSGTLTLQVQPDRCPQGHRGGGRFRASSRPNEAPVCEDRHSARTGTRGGRSRSVSADDLEPAVERRQVHASGRSDQHQGRTGRCNGRTLGPRQRAGNPSRISPAGVRSLLATGRGQGSRAWWPRPRPRDRSSPLGDAWRKRPRHQHRGAGRDILSSDPDR